MFVELPVPKNGTSLNRCVEEYFNQCELVTKKCDDCCKKLVQAEKRSQLINGAETQFFIVILGRVIYTEDGNQILNNEINSKDDVFIR